MDYWVIEGFLLLHKRKYVPLLFISTPVKLFGIYTDFNTQHFIFESNHDYQIEFEKKYALCIL